MEWMVGYGSAPKTIINMPEDGGAASLAPLLAMNQGGLGGMGGLGGILIGALLGGGLGGFGGRGRGGMGGPAAAAVATDVTLTPAFQAIQSQIGTLANQVSQNATNAELESIEGSMNSGLLSILSGIKDNANLYLQGQAALQTAQAAGNFTTLQSLNSALAALTAQANQASLQELNSFNNLTTTTLQGFNSQAMQTQNATNQIIAQGTANAAAMANCCCELKEAIAADGSATRALINDLNVHNLEQQLADAKLSASQTAQTLQLENFIRRVNGVEVVV